MIIGFYPGKSENKYVEKNIKIIENLGDVISLNNYEDIFSKLKKRCFGWNFFDVLIFNWIENRVINSNGAPSVFGALKLLLMLAVAKIISKKIIFVLHNNFPHHASGFGIIFSKFVVNFLIVFADCVVAHAGVSGKKKIKYIPHPLYDISPENSGGCCVGDIPEKYFLMAGRIHPYKNIEKVIEGWPKNIGLIVAGKPSSDDYGEKIINLCINKKNIKIFPSYISDEQLAFFVNRSAGVVVSHSEENMIVSGSYFFAFSYGKPLVAVKNSGIEWIKNNIKSNSIYLFESIEDMCGGIGGIKFINFKDGFDDFSDNACEDAWRKVIID